MAHVSWRVETFDPQKTAYRHGHAGMDAVVDAVVISECHTPRPGRSRASINRMRTS